MALCPSCGKETRRGSSPAASVQRRSMSLPAPAEERKVVSLLFVDLVGFTSQSHDADPEDVRAALGPYHSLS
jgi:class 3 adenylate cyclase